MAEVLDVILAMQIVIVFFWQGGSYSLEILLVLGLLVAIIKQEEETMCHCLNEELKLLQYL